MLLNIPRIITPDLLLALYKMGHTDEIVIADSNFPGATMAKGSVIGEPMYLNGAGVPEVLDAVLQLIPLDYAEQQSVIGVLAPPEQGPMPIHDEFPKVLAKHGYGADRIGWVTKPQFYERARKAAYVVVTGEQARFANIIVRKGVVK